MVGPNMYIVEPEISRAIHVSRKGSSADTGDIKDVIKDEISVMKHTPRSDYLQDKTDDHQEINPQPGGKKYVATEQRA